MTEQKSKKRVDKVYARAFVYRLVDDATNRTFYVGSTSQPLSKRMCCHRVCAVRADSPAYLLPLYQTMREIGIENVRIVLVAEYNNITKIELTKLEQEVIDSCVELRNVRRAYVSDETRKREASEHQKKWLASNPNYHRERYLENPDMYKEKTKAWLLANAERHKCETCNYATALVSNYTAHCLTSKHRAATLTAAIADVRRAMVVVEKALADAQEVLNLVAPPNSDAQRSWAQAHSADASHSVSGSAVD